VLRDGNRVYVFVEEKLRPCMKNPLDVLCYPWNPYSRENKEDAQNQF